MTDEVQQEFPEEPEPSSFRLIFTLGLAGLISGLAIVGIYETTLPMITANKARELREAVFEVVPGTKRIQKLTPIDGALQPTDDEKVEQAIYAGYDDDGAFTGYAIPAQGSGFQDTIALIYGYRPGDKKVVGMRVLDSRETPGLGDKIIKDAHFVSEFDDLSVEPKIVGVAGGAGDGPNEVDTITGATISSKAVIKIINTGNQSWLPLLPPPGEEPAPQSSAAAANSANDQADQAPRAATDTSTRHDPVTDVIAGDNDGR